MPAWLMLLLATACGLIVANLYYAQPVIGLISSALGLSPSAAGLIVTLSQIGYGAGLLLLVPLGDLLENRQLVVCLLVLEMIALAFSAWVTQPGTFLGLALLVGFTSVSVQVLVPYASHLAPPEARGQVVGNVMSGLMLGIMLARPFSSFVTHLWSWQAVYGLSAAMMGLLALLLQRVLPRRQPVAGVRYGVLLRSLGPLFAAYPVLRRRAFYQAGMFGAFSLFWTAVPLWLASPAFGLSQKGIGLFALAGVAGAVASPIAGRVADRGWSRLATVVCMAMVLLALGLSCLVTPGSPMALGGLVTAAVMLDFGVSGNLVLGQRAVFGLGVAVRSRVNGLYMAIFFVGGAIGSALAGWSYAHWGWLGTALIGMALPLAALLYFATEARD